MIRADNIGADQQSEGEFGQYLAQLFDGAFEIAVYDSVLNSNLNYGEGMKLICRYDCAYPE